MMAALLDRWAQDTDPFDIKLGFEVLPSSAGKPHIVDPQAKTAPHYPVSLCGVMLFAEDGFMGGGDVCAQCLTLSVERQAEFDAHMAEVRELAGQAVTV